MTVQTHKLNEVLEIAEARMLHDYSNLPADYFQDKSASTFLFNNVELIDDFYQPETTDVFAVEEQVEKDLRSQSHARIYAGVPWCDQICSFCNYAYSTSKNADVHRAYITVLLDELKLLNAIGLQHLQVSSLYFGGGTPTILEDSLFGTYLERVIASVNLTSSASITCESTPKLMTNSKASLMRKCGVTRLSMGVQSLDECVRSQARLLGSPEDTVATIAQMLDFFDMVNIDLIYGYPYQDDASWYDTVRRIADLAPQSITLYRLEIKDRTYNKKKFDQGDIEMEEEQVARRKYFVAAQMLSAAGYIESPLGWWIRRDKHDQSASWKQHMHGWTKVVPYLGVGQGAWSQVTHVHYSNSASYGSWSKSVVSGHLPIVQSHKLDDRALLLTHLLRHVRVLQCIDLEAMQPALHATSLYEPFERELHKQARWGLLEVKDRTFTLTTAGKSLVHWLLRDLILACLGGPIDA